MEKEMIRIGPRHAAGAAVAALMTLAGASAASQPVPVSVVTVEAEPVVETVRLVGTVVAPLAAEVSSEIASRVAAVEVDLGDRVDAGAPLVTLDDTLERLAMRRLEAAARIEDARLDNARRRLRDAERLMDSNNFPENEVETRRSELDEAEARLAEARAEIARRDARVARHVVRAPFAGTVVDRLVEAGEWVEPGTAIVALVATDRLVVDLPVPQRYYPRVRPDTGVSLRFEALPGTEVEASVAARVPRSDATARTFRLRVAPARDGLEIAPGMSASATLSLSTGREAIVVPRDSVMRHPDGRVTVWVVAEDEDGPVAEERIVSVGSAAGTASVYVSDGLAGGTRVVTRGNESLTPGQRIAPEAPAAGGSAG